MVNNITLTKDDIKKLDNILTDICGNTPTFTLESSSSIHKDKSIKEDQKISVSIQQRIYEVIGEFKTVIRDDTVHDKLVTSMTYNKMILSMSDFYTIKHIFSLIENAEILTLECGEPNGIGDILTLTVPLNMKFSPENYEVQTISGEFKTIIRGVDEW